MRNQRAMYEKTHEYAAEVFRNDTDANGNFQFYPRRARVSDLYVMALAIAAEYACIDSENWLFSKLRTDYSGRFPELIDRTRFNRRRLQLQVRIVELTKRISMTLGVDSSILFVDSMPCPVAKNSRERSFALCKEDPSNAPRKGYTAVNKKDFIGHKLNLLTSEPGTPGHADNTRKRSRCQLPERYAL